MRPSSVVLVALLATTGCRQVLGLEDVECTPSHAAAVTYPSPTVFDIDTGDVNGDGDLDIVAISQSTNTIRRYLGNGDATLQSAVDSASIMTPIDIAIADITGDGRADLLTLAAGALRVLQGRSDSTFEPLQDLTLTSAVDVEVADIDRDGTSDVVAVLSSGGVAVLLASGGMLGALTMYTAHSSASNVEIDDLNNDDILDLIVTHTGQQAPISVLLGKADGTFEARVQTAITGVIVMSYVVGDVNGDRVGDLVTGVGFEGGYAHLVMPGKGDGTFTVPTLTMTDVSMSIPRAIADLDDDGDLDLVLLHYVDQDTYTLDLQHGIGDGTFAAASSFPLSASATTITAAHLDRNPIPDLVMVSRGGNELAVFVGSCTF